MQSNACRWLGIDGQVELSLVLIGVAVGGTGATTVSGAEALEPREESALRSLRRNFARLF